jgi:hypothetical protein
MDIIYLIKDLWRTRNLQDWINNRFNSPGDVIIPKQYFTAIQTQEGILFNIDDQLQFVVDSIRDYNIRDLRPNDKVLDIGANVGGFSLRAARITSHVHAIEPLFSHELERNIELNRSSIVVHPVALGDGSELTLSWCGRRKVVPSYPLWRLIDMVGGCDFLKVDAEGAEWFIDPIEFKDIRRVEIELHRFGSHHQQKFNDFMKFFSRNYTIDFTPDRENPKVYGILHAGIE